MLVDLKQQPCCQHQENEGPEVAFTNLDDAGKEKVHCEVHHTHYNVPPGGDEQIFIGSFLSLIHI